MGEHEPLVLSFSHLKEFPREKDAIQTLKKIASLAKPIMRARGWTVRELAEFYPEQANLLGVLMSLRYNFDAGPKITCRVECQQGSEDSLAPSLSWRSQSVYAY
jgi:hypothetical protein